MNENEEDEYLDLYHTSPEDILEINDEGRFGSNLFFSGRPYYRDSNSSNLYKLKQNKEKILNASDIKNIPTENIGKFLERIKKMTGLNDEESLNILSEDLGLTNFYHDIEDKIMFNSAMPPKEVDRLTEIHKKLENKDIGEIEWDIQHIIGQLAKSLGYEGAKVKDESGYSYIIDMIERLSDLKKQEED